MAIQIFGSSKSFDTKKALRWFAERRIPVQEVNLKDKGISAGELESVISCLAKTCGSRMAAVEELIDTTAKDYAAISYLEDSAKPQKLLDNPLLLRQPIVRNGKTAATVGYRPDVWEEWK